jgi:hypothetical protein
MIAQKSSDGPGFYERTQPFLFWSAVAVVVLGLALLGGNLAVSYGADLEHPSLPTRVFFGFVGALGAPAALFLWLAMWYYWVRHDHSSRLRKSMWFIVLLLGAWFGSSLYYFFVFARRGEMQRGIELR